MLLSKYIIWTLAALIGVCMFIVGFPDEASPLMLVLAMTGIALACFRHFSDDKDFITTLFLAALVTRLAFGVFLDLYPDSRDFFGGDARTYDFFGRAIVDYWLGAIDSRDWGYQAATMVGRPGWGMNYLVAAIYLLTGKTMMAAQSFCAVIGAATPPMVYFCTQKIFGNKGVAKTAALGVAFFPAFIIWSAQLLKDGIIIFLLVVVMTMVLQLQEKINYGAIAILVFSLFGIITLRFYIFYMVAIAVAGGFLVGVSTKSTSIFRRAALLLVIGISLTYLGIIKSANLDYERFGDLERVQISRADLARSGSGFYEEADVSTAEGAITTIPTGLAYLMLAPFPWEASNLRQSITIPEVLLWWAMIPLMILGIAYAVKNRFRSAFPILFFTLVLTLAYSIFQGNVGTAYRQRTQIQVFLFIFIAVGWELLKERRNDRKMERLIKQRKFEQRVEAGVQNW
jgi:4-amino-4-deoxy-L-arabinose transferase-like glycosyltransferase